MGGKRRRVQTEFPARLREAQEAGRISNRKLAEVLDIAESTVYGWIKGGGKGREPSASTIAEVALYFGVSADWLLGLDDRREFVTAEDLATTLDIPLDQAWEFAARLNEVRLRARVSQ